MHLRAAAITAALVLRWFGCWLKMTNTNIQYIGQPYVLVFRFGSLYWQVLEKKIPSRLDKTEQYTRAVFLYVHGKCVRARPYQCICVWLFTCGSLLEYYSSPTPLKSILVVQFSVLYVRCIHTHTLIHGYKHIHTQKHITKTAFGH